MSNLPDDIAATAHDPRNPLHDEGGPEYPARWNGGGPGAWWVNHPDYQPAPYRFRLTPFGAADTMLPSGGIMSLPLDVPTADLVRQIAALEAQSVVYRAGFINRALADQNDHRVAVMRRELALREAAEASLAADAAFLMGRAA